MITARVSGLGDTLTTGAALVEQRIKGTLSGVALGVVLSGVALWAFYPEVAGVLSFLPKRAR